MSKESKTKRSPGFAHITDAQHEAIHWFNRMGADSGVIDKNGRLLVAGAAANFDAVTWLRLATYGLILCEAGRIWITQHGRLYCQQNPKQKSGESPIGRHGRVDPYPGAE